MKDCLLRRYEKMGDDVRWFEIRVWFPMWVVFWVNQFVAVVRLYWAQCQEAFWPEVMKKLIRYLGGIK